MNRYSASPDVRRLLEESFLEERDLYESLREHRPSEDPSEPGIFLSSFLMTVRRPMDLETAELRRVHVRMRRVESGYEVVSIRGLPGSVEPSGRPDFSDGS